MTITKPACGVYGNLLQSLGSGDWWMRCILISFCSDVWLGMIFFVCTYKSAKHISSFLYQAVSWIHQVDRITLYIWYCDIFCIIIVIREIPMIIFVWWSMASAALYWSNCTSEIQGSAILNCTYKMLGMSTCLLSRKHYWIRLNLPSNWRSFIVWICMYMLGPCSWVRITLLQYVHSLVTFLVGFMWRWDDMRWIYGSIFWYHALGESVFLMSGVFNFALLLFRWHL